MTQRMTGQCLCGDVRFICEGELKISICHCKMCQAWVGGPAFSAGFDLKVEFTEDKGLAWYDSSDFAQRGFCKTCGSSLFFRLKSDPDTISPHTGCLDLPNGLKIANEIFVDDKPDFYAFEGCHARLTRAEVVEKMRELGLDVSE
ncbi:MAG: GFA family protein [Pseudomonadota bacterium]